VGSNPNYSRGPHPITAPRARADPRGGRAYLRRRPAHFGPSRTRTARVALWTACRHCRGPRSACELPTRGPL